MQEHNKSMLAKRTFFLDYIKSEFKPELVYYPEFRGDDLPQKNFGKYNVIHQSPERSQKFFDKFGEGIKIIGDSFNSPLADNSVDAVFLRRQGTTVYLEDSIKDFDRVLKSGGVIFAEMLNFYDRQEWGAINHALGLYASHNFTRIDLPNDFRENQITYGIKDGDDASFNCETGYYVESEQEMKDIVVSSSEEKPLMGLTDVWDYAVFKKN